MRASPATDCNDWQLLRTSIAIVVGVVALWLVGFGGFLFQASRNVSRPAHFDAIVVLTGGPDRVEAALRLLTNGTADQLLVSGAGGKTDLADLAHLAGMNASPLEGQVTLGHAAHSTRGNALETVSWVREHGVRSLLVVTSWFHMPRALIELRRVMPEVATYPYAIGRLGGAEFREGDARRLVGEYHKFLAALAGITAMPVVIAVWGEGASR